MKFISLLSLVICIVLIGCNNSKTEDISKYALPNNVRQEWLHILKIGTSRTNVIESLEVGICMQSAIVPKERKDMTPVMLVDKETGNIQYRDIIFPQDVKHAQIWRIILIFDSTDHLKDIQAIPWVMPLSPKSLVSSSPNNQ